MHDPLTQRDIEAFNRVLGRALVDPSICARLLAKDRRLLLSEYRFSENTWQWLNSIPFASLQQLAQAIVCRMEADEHMASK